MRGMSFNKDKYGRYKSCLDVVQLLFCFYVFISVINYLHGIRGRRQLEFRTSTDEENLDRLERNLHDFKITAEDNEKKYTEVIRKLMACMWIFFFLTEVAGLWRTKRFSMMGE